MTLGKSADQILGLADIETLIGCINQHVNNILCSELRLVLGTRTPVLLVNTELALSG